MRTRRRQGYVRGVALQIASRARARHGITGPVAVVVGLLLCAGTAAAAGPTWTLQSASNPGGARGSSMYGVSCTSASACTGVGTYRDSADRKMTLAERWDGTSWTVQQTPNLTRAGNQLLSVSCVARVCAAVGIGRVNGQATSVPLAERWKGSRWTMQRAANPGGANGSTLYGVSCTGPSACTAVGWYSVGSIGAFAALAERWDGVAWIRQSTPNPPGGAFLNWVSCPTVASCIAVGSYYDRFGTPLPMAERWDGRTWKLQQMPVPAASWGTNVAPTVSCSAADACTAVWSYLDGSGTWVPIAERWDGTAWTIQATPAPADATLTYLYSVGCDAANSCTAVGFYRNSAAIDVTLAMHWDGAKWTLEASPTPASAQLAYLGDISCPAGGLCTAVGNYRDGDGNNMTFTEVRR